jgi:Zn finger protein HypA/HybF involved in hydrogenase expression
MLTIIKETTSTIHISHSVDCPHCNETFFDDLDRDWWDSNITDQLPNLEYYKDTYDVTCPKCNKLFKITEFIY